jgi:hypothetical protein
MKDITLPIRVKLIASYDTRRGNPHNQYDENDFNFNDNIIKIEYKGCKVLSIQRNSIVLVIKDIDMNLKAIGFDPNRDLVVDINEGK